MKAKRGKGSIVDGTSDALVNTVNCEGVMGKGIALLFKKAFPENFDAYKEACEKQEVQIGQMFVFVAEAELHRKRKFIINFPTKNKWQNKSRIEDIKKGLKDLKIVIRDKKIKSIAIPALGCGLGGLVWSEVKPLIEEALRGPDLESTIYQPINTPKSFSKGKKRSVLKMTTAGAVLVKLIDCYVKSESKRPKSVPLQTLQMLMYFTEVSGEKT